MKIKCNECYANIEVLDDVISGEIVTCQDCGMDFEVVIESNDGVKLKPAEIEGEDWGE